jgi:hypothetical protein
MNCKISRSHSGTLALEMVIFFTSELFYVNKFHTFLREKINSIQKPSLMGAIKSTVKIFSCFQSAIDLGLSRCSIH